MGICETKPSFDSSRGKLTLELTTSALCDLDCTYCFEGAKVNAQKLEALDVLIQRIYELLESDWYKTKYNGLSISFWGGEPTLNPHYIIKIMNELQHREDVVFHMYSNGFNRKNMIKILDNVNTSKFEIQISYDGRSINDQFRLTKNGKTTSDMVLETFEYLVDRGITVFFKSTLPSKAIGSLHKSWLDFEQLFLKYKAKSPDTSISFAPTIDYSMLPSEETKVKKVAVFREQMLAIAKEEIRFFETHGRHLCTWFNAGDQKTNCSAGLNMVSIDVDGDSYACHGALYAEKKEDMKSSSIFEDDFVNKIMDFNDGFEKSVKTVSDVCKDCVATMCMICPVATYDISKKEDFFGKWGDRQVNGLCDFYQTFGEIDRSVQRYILMKKEK